MNIFQVMTSLCLKNCSTMLNKKKKFGKKYTKMPKICIMWWYHGWLFFMSLYHFLFLIELTLKSKLRFNKQYFRFPVCVRVLNHFSRVWLFVTLWTIAHSASLSMGFSKARILELEWVAMSFSRTTSWPRDRIHVCNVSCIGWWVLYH